MNAKLWIVQGVPPADMPDCFRAADCVLLTSDWEGSPNVVKEAICCDVPVVSVNAGDVGDWIAMTPGCLLVSRDPCDIARGLEEVLTGPRHVDGAAVRRAMGLPGIAERVIDVYRQVTGAERQQAGPTVHPVS
jgi:glycosyltransferase involved in cell wall biosynthesis